ncbi:MAG TPA: hypothetical protein VIK35_00295 [Verrucomicrobiae bacterium]
MKQEIFRLHLLPSFNSEGVEPCFKTRAVKSQSRLANFQGLGDSVFMTREQIEAAVASGEPFTLRMADGREYAVPHRDYISLSPRAPYAIVHEDDGHFNVLPLLTMTGLRSQHPAEKN